MLVKQEADAVYHVDELPGSESVYVRSPPAAYAMFAQHLDSQGVHPEIGAPVTRVLISFRQHHETFRTRWTWSFGEYSQCAWSVPTSP